MEQSRAEKMQVHFGQQHVLQNWGFQFSVFYIRKTAPALAYCAGIRELKRAHCTHPITKRTNKKSSKCKSFNHLFCIVRCCFRFYFSLLTIHFNFAHQALITGKFSSILDLAASETRNPQTKKKKRMENNNNTNNKEKEK